MFLLKIGDLLKKSQRWLVLAAVQSNIALMAKQKEFEFTEFKKWTADIFDKLRALLMVFQGN